MTEFIREAIIPNFNYWVYIVLMMIGLFAMIAKNNLIKKLIGMSIFQTAIILFYVSIGVKEGATIPILDHHGEEKSEVRSQEPGVRSQNSKHEAAHDAVIEVADYANPLPHVLMLTAIVVGVATLGVGLAVAQKVYAEFGSLEEDEILERIKASDE